MKAMNRDSTIVAVPLLVSGLAAVFVVAVFDRFNGRPALEETTPDWDAGTFMRSALLAVASFALAAGARRLAERWLAPAPVAESRYVWVAASVGFAASALFASIAIVDPERLTTLASEDGIVENLSAALAFASAGILLAAAYLQRRRGRSTGRLGLIGLLGLAGVFALIGLEEVSWFQRVADIETPEFLQDRNQPETNFHNGATDLAEAVYYTGAFIFTVALPYLLADRRLPPALAPLQMLVPSRLVLLGAIPAAAIVFEMWGIIPIQVAFFMSLFILVTWSRSEPPVAILAVVLLAILVTFMVAGPELGRSWDDTEVRELIIPYGFLLYALQVLGVARREAVVAVAADRSESGNQRS